MLKQHLREAYHTGKRHVLNAYKQATHWAGQLDAGVSMGKRIFAALDPLISEFGGSKASRAIVDSFGSYERGRDQVLGGHNKVQNTLSRLRAAVPEISLDN